MTIQEVIKSGKPFKRPNGEFIHMTEHHDFYYFQKSFLDSSDVKIWKRFDYEEIMATDWTVEETKTLVGRSDLESLQKYNGFISVTELCEKLGL